VTACLEFESLQLIASVPFDATSVRTGGCGVHVSLRKRVGRPRKHKSSADRQSEYRKRKRQEREAAAVPVEPNGLDSMSRGVYISQADHGKGKLFTGGYGSEKIAEVSDAGERDENGRRQRPEGQGAAGQAIGRDEDGAESIVEVDKGEYEDTFIKKQERNGAFERPAKKLGKKQFKKSVRRLFCCTHSIVSAGTAGAFRDGGGQWVLLFTATPGPGGTLEMSCGCCRKIEAPNNIVTPVADSHVPQKAA